MKKLFVAGIALAALVAAPAMAADLRVKAPVYKAQGGEARLTSILA